MSLVDENGWAWKSSKIKNYKFVKDSRWRCMIFVHKSDLYQPNLIIRYQLRRSHNPITRPQLLCAKTQIVKLDFVWKINNFFSLYVNEKKEIYIKSSLLKSPVLKFQLYKEETKNNQISIDITSGAHLSFKFLCNIAVLDHTGKILKSKRGGHSFESKENCCEQTFHFPLFINKTEILKYHRSSLPPKARSLQIICFFWAESATGENISSLNLYVDENLTSPRPNSIWNFVEHHGRGRYLKGENLLHPSNSDIKSKDKKTSKPQDKQSLVNNLSINQGCDELSMPEEMSCQGKLHIQPNAKITLRMKEIEQSITEIDDPDFFISGNTCCRETTQKKNDACYLKGFVDDIYSSYKNGWLSDFRLYSGNKTFPVHKVILSARSPVFRAMFVSTLKDKDDLDIADIDVDTLERMILFIYSNKAEDLEWNIAINLYSAAYRYAIADLKRITRSSLISKISASNVLGILVQANLHEDEDLKSSAERFIVENDEDIVGTEHWKKFEKEHVHLAVQILNILYVQIKNKLIK